MKRAAKTFAGAIAAAALLVASASAETLTFNNGAVLETPAGVERVSCGGDDDPSIENFCLLTPAASSRATAAGFIANLNGAGWVQNPDTTGNHPAIVADLRKPLEQAGCYTHLTIAVLETPRGAPVNTHMIILFAPRVAVCDRPSDGSMTP